MLTHKRYATTFTLLHEIIVRKMYVQFLDNLQFF